MWEFEGPAETVAAQALHVRSTRPPHARGLCQLGGRVHAGVQEVHRGRGETSSAHPTNCMDRRKRPRAAAAEAAHRSDHPGRHGCQSLVESHLRHLLEQGFEVAVVRDAVAAAKLPDGDGYLAALINFRFLANGLWTTSVARERIPESQIPEALGSRPTRLAWNCMPLLGGLEPAAWAVSPWPYSDRSRHHVPQSGLLDPAALDPSSLVLECAPRRTIGKVTGREPSAYRSRTGRRPPNRRTPVCPKTVLAHADRRPRGRWTAARGGLRRRPDDRGRAGLVHPAALRVRAAVLDGGCLPCPTSVAHMDRRRSYRHRCPSIRCRPATFRSDWSPVMNSEIGSTTARGSSTLARPPSSPAADLRRNARAATCSVRGGSAMPTC